MKIRKIAAGIRKTIRKIKLVKKKAKKPIRPEDLLSTGSTLLNLALSGRREGGYVKGKYFLLVGDSASGKTFLSMTCFAEAVRNPEFQDYDLYYDNVEDGMLMDVDQLFGHRVANRLQPPARDKKGEPIFSETIEDFYYRFDDIAKKGKSFIYVLDSMDGLTSEAEDEKFEQQKKAARAGKVVPGSFGDGKAKKNSGLLRRTLKTLRRTKSILIIICQTRDNLNAMFGETKTRSGGRGLRFYATNEFWSSLVGQITKLIRGKKRKIGNYIQVAVKKNRLTGKLNTITTAIYPSYGLDDVGSCVDFMVSEGFWPKKKGKKGKKGGIHAKDLGVVASREKLVRICDERKDELVRAVVKAWNLIEAESALDRKPRYA